MKISTIFLRAAVALLGCAVLGLMLWVPPHEGRNAGAALFDVYFKDPFLAYAYIGSIPFFRGLWQVFRLLGDMGRGELFRPRNVKALRTIRHCALATAGIVLGAVVYICLNANGDDPAGFVVPGTLAVLVCAAAAAAAAVLEKNIGSGAGKQGE